jgi:hypothetical protein
MCACLPRSSKVLPYDEESAEEHQAVEEEEENDHW